MMGLLKVVVGSLVICMVVYSIVGVITLISINNTLMNIENILEDGISN